MPIILQNLEWQEICRAAGKHLDGVFPGAQSEWTADQRRIVNVTKEYQNAFQTLAIYKHYPPGEDILLDYQRFREWWKWYSEDPAGVQDIGRKYSKGFRKR
ncbi:hypothetical protein H1S01_03360 [Heliobacterium chlorum]|uniref:Uncharacterized protein n=1 Tax=Heliobacterium chlorum TaxID=2698 RepID=A0ABR7T0T8_HELCL|nr:hypothetical protein [Heliobacterium chlorum]MBC9783550.1 hypothetical protein [Heliobacterium chlorum]